MHANCIHAFTKSLLLLTFGEKKTFYIYLLKGMKMKKNTCPTIFLLKPRQQRCKIYLKNPVLYTIPRVPRAYWRDRLKKIRAAGLNTVETYVPWNLHEPEPGKYDFGYGGSEFEDFLHLDEFLSTAKQEDLFVILRTGPYICSEFNFGGFPSWLLREKTMGFRTSEPTYMKYVTRYFNVLLTLLAAFQFTKGGPVIAFQVENEYGNQEYKDKFIPDKVYLEELRQLFIRNGIVELLVTSDSPLSHGDIGTLPGIFLQTVNLGASVNEQLDKLEELQPGKAQMIMEFWVGYFDFWGHNHTNMNRNNDKVKGYLQQILDRNASLNIYMFEGGTNFGFNNGAHWSNTLIDNSGFNAITTSYDYDAPLSENGDYREKYYTIRELITAANPIKTFLPEPPDVIPPVVYDTTEITSEIPFDYLIDFNTDFIDSKQLVPMELLDINNGAGQSNGYVLYRKRNVILDPMSILVIEGHVCDTVMVLVDGELIASTSFKSLNDVKGFGYWMLNSSAIILNEDMANEGLGKISTIDLLVEEMGRINGGAYFQYNKTFKGLWQGNVSINSENIEDWQITSLEMRKNWINNLQGWIPYEPHHKGPTMYKTILHVHGKPKDTYIDTRGWGKGMIFVNGFALGRYAAIGPQKSLYLPGAFLNPGPNEIVFFEHFYAPENGAVVYTDKLLYENILEK